MLELTELINDAVIKVIGAGGGDGSAVGHIVRERIEDAEFFTVNTDAQALRKTVAGQTIQIGSGITKGLDAGTNPEVGRNVVDKDHDVPRAALEGTNMALIVAGMGGGTGTGIASVVVEVARGLNILIVAVVTKPFNSEGRKRMAFAKQGITELSKHVDSLITIPNNELLKILGCDISLLDAFGTVNDVFKDVVQGATELTVCPGLMNADFADVRTVASEAGYAVMGPSMVSSEDRVEEAAEMAISSPLLEDIDLSGTRSVLVNITVGFDLCLDKFETVSNTIYAFAPDNATVAINTSLSPDMSDELRVAAVAMDIGIDKRPEITLMTNKQIQRPVVDRYQQHGMTPLTQGWKPVAKVMNSSAPQTAKKPDYSDIPALLRKQTD